MEYSDLVHYADPDKTYTPLGKYKQYVQTLVNIPLKYQLNVSSCRGFITYTLQIVQTVQFSLVPPVIYSQ